MVPKRLLRAVVMLACLIILTSCAGIVLKATPAEIVRFATPGIAAVDYLSKVSSSPFFQTSTTIIANDGLTAIVVVWADVKQSETAKPVRSETVVTLEGYGNDWRGKKVTPWRSISRPPTSSITSVEVVEIPDSSGFIDLKYCTGKNVNPSTPPSFLLGRKLQLCFDYSAVEDEVLTIQHFSDIASFGLPAGPSMLQGKYRYLEPIGAKLIYLKPPGGRILPSFYLPEGLPGRFGVEFVLYSKNIAQYTFVTKLFEWWPW